MSEALDGWSEFNVAMVGATAALAGLLIVAMSVNIGSIMASRSLSARAASSIATLVVAIFSTGLALVPGQPVEVLGVEVAFIVAVASILEVHALRAIAADERPASGTERFAKSAAGLAPLVVFAVGAVLLIAGVDAAGLVLLAVGTLLAIAAAIVFAWVVLVEVLR
jgi:hypothetical protein